jgi:hypothetical protein
VIKYIRNGTEKEIKGWWMHIFPGSVGQAERNRLITLRRERAGLVGRVAERQRDESALERVE